MSPLGQTAMRAALVRSFFYFLELLVDGRAAIARRGPETLPGCSSKGVIKRRLEEATKFTDLDRLCLSPQCGFASTEERNILAEYEQRAKLRLIRRDRRGNLGLAHGGHG